MSITVGIDLGTTNSAVAIHDGESPRLILNDVGSNLTPSAIWEDPSGKLVFGSVAYQKAGAASRFKRSMGSNTSFEVGTHSLSPEECSALVLRKLVVDAERSLGDEISSAVITVPANWKDAPRRATETAGRLAGLKVERLINEPTAAAMAYGLRADADGKTIAVYDLGGGTFDITLLRVRERVFDVLTSCGDEKLGGLDFDKRILELVMSRIEQQSGSRLPPVGGRAPKMELGIRVIELRGEAG
jgi:molecular chaperone HscC